MGDPVLHGVDGRVVVVTGAGQGIGRGIAHHLGKHGASIVVAECKPHRTERVVGELTELGVKALGVQTDILRRAPTRHANPTGTDTEVCRSQWEKE